MNLNMKSAGFVYIYFCVYTNIIVVGEVFTLGYLTGSQRRSGDFEYAKPGTCIELFYLHSIKKNSRSIICQRNLHL